MRLPKLQECGTYFIVDSIGGMNEGYSDTTCNQISDFPDVAKSMVEEYLDQWMHEMTALYTNLAEEMMVPMQNLKFKHEENVNGLWHKVYVDLEASGALIEDFPSEHALFIQTHFDTVRPTVVMYNQTEDVVDDVLPKHTAMHRAEEWLSLIVDRMKRNIHNGDADTMVTTNLIYCYDCLSDVVRELDSAVSTMIDIDDCCMHFFPTEDVCHLNFNTQGRIVQTPTKPISIQYHKTYS